MDLTGDRYVGVYLRTKRCYKVMADHFQRLSSRERVQDWHEVSLGLVQGLLRVG